MTPSTISALALALVTTLWAGYSFMSLKRLKRRQARELERILQDQDLYEMELAEEFSRLKRAERDLREHQAFSESLFQATQAGQMIINSETHQVMDINQAGANILGAEIDDVIGENAKKFIPCSNENEECTATSGEPATSSQVEFTRLDGSTVSVMRSITELWGQTSKLVVASFLDISELKDKEKELVEFNDKLGQTMDQLKKTKEHAAQSEKLASIGQLAAGVAHEINNPVGFVTSNLGTIQDYSRTIQTLMVLYSELEEMEDGAARQALVKKIAGIREEEDLEFILDDMDGVLNESMGGVKRVAEIVANLKSFARTDAPTLEDHDLNEGLEKMIKMVWNELKYHCQVEKNFGEVPLVPCHPGQINQVLMNMLVNASHAIGEDGGTITVGTSIVRNMVQIKINDTGKGIPADILPRIFDPFFTTKEVGKGTGLGLSISHGIIQDHKGRIEVDSVVGEGTEFRIFLPLKAPGQDTAEEPGQSNQTSEEELIG